MIKKYPEFKKLREYPNLGNWVKSLCQNDEFIRSIVGEITRDVDPKVGVSNAVEVLDNSKKLELVNRIQSYLDRVDSTPDITTSVDVYEKIEESYGKGIFTTFLKCLTALGLKDNSPSDSPSNDWIVYFEFKNLDPFKVNSVFSRFKSLSQIDLNFTYDVSLYFGIKDSLILEYGWFDKTHNQIGKFPISRSVINWIKTSNMKSLTGIRKFLLNISKEDIQIFSKLKSHIQNLEIGGSKIMIPKISDRVITFGWYGVGKWEDSKMSSENLEVIKDKIRNHILKLKFNEKLLISVTADNFWLYLKIKLK